MKIILSKNKKENISLQKTISFQTSLNSMKISHKPKEQIKVDKNKINRIQTNAMELQIPSYLLIVVKFRSNIKTCSS
jgi:hypothetical protein